MNSALVGIIISLAGVLFSVIASVFVAGMHTGQLRADVRMIADRLAKIEGMFTLRLREDK